MNGSCRLVRDKRSTSSRLWQFGRSCRRSTGSSCPNSLGESQRQRRRRGKVSPAFPGHLVANDAGRNHVATICPADAGSNLLPVGGFVSLREAGRSREAKAIQGARAAVTRSFYVFHVWRGRSNTLVVVRARSSFAHEYSRHRLFRACRLRPNPRTRSSRPSRHQVGALLFFRRNSSGDLES